MWIYVPFAVMQVVALTVFNWAITVFGDVLLLIFNAALIAGISIPTFIAAFLAHPLLFPLAVIAMLLIGLTSIGTLVASLFAMAHLWLPLTFGIVPIIWFILFESPILFVIALGTMVPLIGWIPLLIGGLTYWLVGQYGTGLLTALSFNILVMGILWPIVSTSFTAILTLAPFGGIIAPIAALILLPLIASMLAGMFLLILALLLVPVIGVILPLVLLGLMVLPLLLPFILLAVVPLLLLALPLLLLGTLALSALITLPLTLGLKLLNLLIAGVLGLITFGLAALFGVLPVTLLLGLGSLLAILANLALLGLTLVPGLHQLLTFPLMLLTLPLALLGLLSLLPLALLQSQRS